MSYIIKMLLPQETAINDNELPETMGGFMVGTGGHQAIIPAGSNQQPIITHCNRKVHAN